MDHQSVFSLNKNEYIVKYDDSIGEINIDDVFFSQKNLTIQYLMEDIYNKENISLNRKGTAYCIRKGKGREIIHDLKNSICIDGLTHSETAAIFKKIETFISYDVATFYSQYAVMCGADSVVIPHKRLTKDEWRSMPGKSGVAYGFNDLGWAKETNDLFNKYYYLEKKEENINQCNEFIRDIHMYFK